VLNANKKNNRGKIEMEMQGNIDGEIFSTCFTRGSGMEN
jgi:hypothetical protein